MNSVRATPFVLMVLGLMFVVYPAVLARREDEEPSSGVMGFFSSLFQGLLEFIPESNRLLAARALGVVMIAAGGWMLASFHGGTTQLKGGGGIAANEVALIETEIVEASLVAEDVREEQVASEPNEVREEEKAELIAIASSGAREETGDQIVEVESEIAAAEEAPAKEEEVAEEADVTDEADAAKETTEETTETEPAEDLQSLFREKPKIPNEPSPFIDNFPKPKAAPEKAAPGKGNVRMNSGMQPTLKPKATPKPVDPFAAAKNAPAPPKATPKPATKPAPKVEATPEPEPTGIPNEPNPAKLAEADELLKKAKMMWELEEYESAVKLAEKARKLRASQLGDEHEKVIEVDGMIKAAREKAEKP